MVKQPKYRKPEDTNKLWRELVDDLRTSEPLELPAGWRGFSSFASFAVNGDSVTLTDDTAKRYFAVGRSLAREQAIANIASRRYVEKALQPAVAQVIRHHENGSLQDAPSYLESVRSSLLKGVRDWTAIIPVVGVRFDGLDSIALGDVRLVACGSPEARVLRQQIEQAVQTHQSRFSMPGYDRFLKVLTALGGKDWYAAVVAQVRGCDGQFAVDRGTGIAKEFMATLRVFAVAIWRRLIGFVGVADAVPTCVCSGVAFTLDGGWNGPRIEPDVPPPWVVISHPVRQALQELGWERLSEIWSKGDNNWKKAVRAAAHWLGMAMAEREPSVAFLHCATAQEMLLLGRGEKEEIAKTLAERLALVIAEKPQDRLQTYRQAKRLQGIRSAIVHRGQTDVAEDDVSLMRGLSIACFFALLKRLAEIGSEKALIDMCEQAKFGVEPSTGRKTG